MAVLLMVRDTPEDDLQYTANAAGCRASLGTLMGKAVRLMLFGVRQRILGLLGHM
jgi:hypothetical protein